MQSLEYSEVTPGSLLIRKNGEEFEAIFTFSHRDGESELIFGNVEDSIDLGHLMAAKKLGIFKAMRSGEEIESLVASITHQYLVEIEFEHISVRS